MKTINESANWNIPIDSLGVSCKHFSSSSNLLRSYEDLKYSSASLKNIRRWINLHKNFSNFSSTRQTSHSNQSQRFANKFWDTSFHGFLPGLENYLTNFLFDVDWLGDGRFELNFGCVDMLTVGNCYQLDRKVTNFYKRMREFYKTWRKFKFFAVMWTTRTITK